MKQQTGESSGLLERTKEMLPGQGVLDLPRLNMLGNRYIELENHLGILSYSLTEAVIALKTGELRIKGQRLEISKIDREFFCLAGIIEEIQFRL
jgi:sporulation protein YqfC